MTDYEFSYASAEEDNNATLNITRNFKITDSELADPSYFSKATAEIRKLYDDSRRIQLNKIL